MNDSFPPAVPTVASTSKPRWPFPPLLIGLGVSMALTMLGAVLPWARVGSLSFTGTDGGGLLTLILAIVTLVAVAVWRGRRWVLIFSVIAAVLAGLIVMVNLSDVSRLAGGFDIVSTGPGLWISAIAVALWTLVSIVALARAKTFRPTV
jgi:hypothetical protein